MRRIMGSVQRTRPLGWCSVIALGVSLGVGLALLADNAIAQTLLTNQEDLRVDASGSRSTLRAEAREWGLEQKDWERYETLMQGSRGIWSPGLDPITALGVEARTDAERRRYAEMLVEVEKARVERELAFQRAYDEAWARLYPNAMAVNTFTSNQDSGSVFPTTAGASPQRVSVHVAADDCAQCDATIAQLLSRGVAMDVFVIDSEGDDSVIRDWARQQHIPVSRVQRREITLNHGRSDPALGVTRDSVPKVFTQ